MNNVLDVEAIKGILPHREPILLVGEVKDWVANEALESARFFPADDPVFLGHFPGHPILPGVLAVEAMAQSAGLLVNLSLGLTSAETLFYFLAVDGVRFKKPVLPGDTLEMSIKLLRSKAGIYVFEGKGYVAGALAVEAGFSAKLVIKDKA